jgi:hypothetical protein
VAEEKKSWQEKFVAEFTESSRNVAEENVQQIVVLF